MAEQQRGPFEKFVDWRQCAAVMQREAYQHNNVLIYFLAICEMIYRYIENIRCVMWNITLNPNIILKYSTNPRHTNHDKENTMTDVKLFLHKVKNIKT
jgi:hypothetical protein